MDNIILLGLEHGTGSFSGQCFAMQASGPESDRFLKTKYFPSFNEKHTLLIVEGNFHKDILKPEYATYERLLPGVSLALLESDFGPDILYADTRHRNTKKGLEAYMEENILGQWMRNNIVYPEIFLQRNLELNDIIKEIVERTGVNILKFTNKPDSRILQLASEKLSRNNRMEKYMLEKAYQLSKNYDQILILTGVGHSIEMHRSSKLTFDCLYEIKNQEDARELFFSCLFMNEVPRLMIEQHI